MQNESLNTASGQKSKPASQTSGTSLSLQTVEDLMNRSLVCIESGQGIREAAQLMTQKQVSSLLIVQKDNKNKLLGILTDKDFRQRCIANGMASTAPVDDIMTQPVLTISSKTMAFEALMLMTRRHIRHLPVYDEKGGNHHVLKGMLSLTDLMLMETSNPAYLTKAIRKAHSSSEIVRHSQQIPGIQSELVRRGANAEQIGNSISAITTAITTRLIELAEQKLGAPPVPYAWVAAGSQARREQTSHSDQDNGLIISNAFKPEDEQWFAKLAEFVCDGLNAAGFIYCPGDVMAKNPKWRQTQQVWQGYFDEWIRKPEPMALMYSSLFFDLRTIHGDKNLLDTIRTKMLSQTPQQTWFLGMLVANALKLKPPLGFFGDFVLEHDKQHTNTLDLKHYGIIPIVDLARIYALSEGIPEVNTIERLKKVAGTPSLSEEGAADLLDAYKFITGLRIQHQVKQIENGKPADNFMPPAVISRLERSHLKDAFKVIKTLQSHLKMRF